MRWGWGVNMEENGCRPHPTQELWGGAPRTAPWTGPLTEMPAHAERAACVLQMLAELFASSEICVF